MKTVALYIICIQNNNILGENMSRIRKHLKEMYLIRLAYKKILIIFYKHFANPIRQIKKRFKKRTNRELELANPQKYNDKLQWLKFNWYDKKAEVCVDKYAVRELVSSEVGREYLNELYGLYDSYSDIDFDKLPNMFALKTTNGSGTNIICRDKSKLNLKKVKQDIKIWLMSKSHFMNAEWVYKNLKPRIIIEKFMQDKTGNPPMDYKIFCFHGEPKLIQVDIDRFSEHKQNFYDENWNFRDVKIWCDNDKENKIEKPKNFDKMIEISKKLSKPFPHVRVDLYNVSGKIIFGELTFFHLSGMKKFIDEDLELEMGSWLDLSKIDNNGVYKN